jgi:hypothetical protein
VLGTKGQRLILHIDQDSLVAIQKTGYKILTGLSQGKEETAPYIASSELVSEGEGERTLTPSDDRRDAREDQIYLSRSGDLFE